MNRSENVLYVIGAGFAGQMVASDIKRKKIFGKVKAFLDDDKNLIGTQIEGIPVLGPVCDIARVLNPAPNDEAILAIPTAANERIASIYKALKAAGFSRIKILPSISQVVNGTAHLVQAREIDPLDILGRTPVTIPLKESLSYLRGKRVLVTGAGGSVGSELSRQLLSGGAERIYLFGHGENSIYQIDRELHILQSEGVGEAATIVPIIGDMKDRDYVRHIVFATKCDAIFHCAAYKHVPLMEENPVAAVENNVFGTKNFLDAALEFRVKRFVLISTDKAVSPVCVYGASKMLCEKLVLQAAKKIESKNLPKANFFAERSENFFSESEDAPSEKNFSEKNAVAKNAKSKKNSSSAKTNSNFEKDAAYMFVRFGNVLGSRGSILPLFMEQIKNGGPVTVTSKKMERYFMTIPEACSLVLQAGGVGKNAASYLLDMGEAVKIKDLAEQIILFSGLEVGKDIEIKYTAPRKGERLTEPLWEKSEEPVPTKFPKILKLNNSSKANFDLDEILEELRPVCFFCGNEKLFRNAAALKKILCKAAPSLKKICEEK